MRPALTLITLVIALAPAVRAQLQPLEIDDLQSWKQIKNQHVAADGRFIVYDLVPDVGDPTTVVYAVKSGLKKRFDNLHDTRLSYDGQFLIATQKPDRDTVKKYTLAKEQETLKKKNKLFLLRLGSGSPTLFDEVYDIRVGKKWTSHVAYTTASNIPDSLRKDMNEDARLLMVRSLDLRDSFFIEGITEFTVADSLPAVLAHRVAKDSTWPASVEYLDTRKLKWKTVSRGDLTYAGLALDRTGEQAAFLSHPADLEDQQPPFDLHYFRAGTDSATVRNRAEGFVPRGNRLTDDRAPAFSYDGRLLYFGYTPRRPERDTTLMDDEIADVEVWTTEDPRIYTQENVRLKDEQKRSYLASLNLEDGSVHALAGPTLPEVTVPRDRRGHYVAVYSETPYAKARTWEGFPGRRDLAVVNARTGERQTVGTGEELPVRWTETGRHLLWYAPSDTAWYAFDPATGRRTTLTTTATGTFQDELNDRPMNPRSYGYGGTLTDGQVLLYDRYDIWLADPSGTEKIRRLTRGRADRTRYRVSRAVPEKHLLDLGLGVPVVLFDEDDKHGGLGVLTRTGVRPLQTGPHQYGNIRKARRADTWTYTKEDFVTFPDLLVSTSGLGGTATRVSFANPQQSQFSWGTAEPYTWIDHEGRRLEGTLVKPAGFDPEKRYPMLVNFYERSSDRLYRHRTPYPHRSTINYSYYASRGYLIFNPDVIYRVGYPGESAYDCVMSGVSALIAGGFVDKERIGLQGHSWGGYQAAYIATKTSLFAAIESGAPVVNMFSAYGGIRWGSGLSRQFQYERTQSRIGGTPWEYPLRYLENSPLFTTDKITTPILILHNDADGAVPWYQGIEWYTALRRLGKDAWLLNYRGEPHWPLKPANRRDFNLRMSQFFDHYLKGEPMPRWMKEGVKPIARGIDQGYELSRE